MQLRMLYWYIDRWRKSSAFMHMTLEEQGAYRNLLDEAQLRGGALPTDERVLARACGDPLRWRSVRRAVMQHFKKLNDGWHNDTLDYSLHQSLRRAAKQQAYRDRVNGNQPGNQPGNKTGNGHGNGHGNEAGNKPGNKPGYQYQYQTVRTNPPNPPSAKGGKKPTRDELKRARDIRRIRMGCRHDPKCPNVDTCVRAIVGELRANGAML